MGMTATGQNLIPSSYAKVVSTTPTQTASETIEIAVSLDGAVRSISSDLENAGTTIGGIGVTLYKKQAWRITAQININSTIDTRMQLNLL